MLEARLVGVRNSFPGNWIEYYFRYLCGCQVPHFDSKYRLLRSKSSLRLASAIVLNEADRW